MSVILHTLLKVSTDKLNTPAPVLPAPVSTDALVGSILRTPHLYGMNEEELAIIKRAHDLVATTITTKANNQKTTWMFQQLSAN